MEINESLEVTSLIHETELEEKVAPVYSVSYPSISFGSEVEVQGFNLSLPRLEFDLLGLNNDITEYSKPYYNFFKSALWSPDGSSILSVTQDRKILVFYPDLSEPTRKLTLEESMPDELPNNDVTSSLTPFLNISRAMPTTAISWYPYMNYYQDASSSCFLVASTDCPVHLVDGLTGETRGSYPLIDHRERFVGANSITFHPEGRRVYCGYDNMIHIIDISRPGWEGWKQPTCESRKSRVGHKGIISCLEFFPENSIGGQSIYAAGSFSGDIAIYDERSGTKSNYPTTILPKHQKLKGRGITHMKFSSDSPYKLYCGGRRSSFILEYDLRKSPHPIQFFHRPLFTDQRMSFDLKDGFLATGDQNGEISFFDLNTSPVEDSGVSNAVKKFQFKAHGDAIASTQFHPTLPLVLSVSGSRYLKCSPSSSDAETSESPLKKSSQIVSKEASLKIWDLPTRPGSYMY